MIGPLPSEWQDFWKTQHAKFFDRDGRRLNVDQGLWLSLEEAFQGGIQTYREKLKVGVLDKDETEAFLDLMRKMLVFRLADRLTIDEVLGSKWVTGYYLTLSEGGIQFRDNSEFTSS